MAPSTYVPGGGGGHRRLPGWEKDLPLKDLLGLGGATLEASKPGKPSKKWHADSFYADGVKSARSAKPASQNDVVTTNVVLSSPKNRSGPRTASNDDNWTGVSIGVAQSFAKRLGEISEDVVEIDDKAASAAVFNEDVTHERFTGSLGSMKDALQYFDDIHKWTQASKYDAEGSFGDMSAMCKDPSGVDDAMELLEVLSDSLILEVERVDYHWNERSKGMGKTLPVRVHSPLVTVWERPDGATFHSKSQKDGGYSIRCDLLAGEMRRMRFDLSSARPAVQECLQKVPEKGEPMVASWRKAVQAIHRGEATLKHVWQISLQTLSSQLSFKPDAATDTSVVKQHINAVLAQYVRLVTSMMQAVGPVFPSACDALEVLFKGLCKLVDGVTTSLHEDLINTQKELKKRTNELAQANNAINELEEEIDQLQDLISRDPAMSVQRSSIGRRESSAPRMSTLVGSLGGRSPSFMVGKGGAGGSFLNVAGRISEVSETTSSVNRASTVMRGRASSVMSTAARSSRFHPSDQKRHTERKSEFFNINDDDGMTAARTTRLSQAPATRLSQTVFGAMKRKTRAGMVATDNRMERGTQTEDEEFSGLPDGGRATSTGIDAMKAVMRMNKLKGNAEASAKVSNEPLHHNRTWEGLLRICQDAKLPPIPQSEVFDLAAKMIASLLKEHHAVTGVKQPFDALRTIRTQYLHTYGTVNAAARNLANHVAACSKAENVRKGQTLTKMLDYAPAAECFSADTTDVYMFSMFYCQKCIREQVTSNQKRHQIPYERACKYLFCFLKAQSGSSMFGLHDTDNLWDQLEDAAFFTGDDGLAENRRKAEIFRNLLFERIGTRSAKPFNFMIKGLDNGSGFVDGAVFSSMMNRLGHYVTKRTLLLLDKGGTGSVNLEEFRHLLTSSPSSSSIWVQEDQFLEIILAAWQRYNLQVEEALLELFVLFDDSGDGHLQIDEFTSLCQGLDPNIPDERIMTMFESAADFEGSSSNEDGMSAELFVRVYRKFNLEGLEIDCEPKTEVVDPEVMNELSRPTSTVGASFGDIPELQGRRRSEKRDSMIPLENLNLLGRLRRLIFDSKKRQIAVRAAAEEERLKNTAEDVLEFDVDDD